jgi:hypothetical protein
VSNALQSEVFGNRIARRSAIGYALNMLLAWTAAFGIAIAFVLICVVSLLGAAAWMLPASTAKTTLQIIIAGIGLAICTLLLWRG